MYRFLWDSVYTYVNLKSNLLEMNLSYVAFVNYLVWEDIPTGLSFWIALKWVISM